MMNNPERANRIIAYTLSFAGLILAFFTAGLYFFLREDWQIILAFVGLGLMLFGMYADN